MRRTVSAILGLAFISQTAQAQLTLTPRIGVENSRALVSVNDSKFFSPISSQFSPQAGIRLDYKFKTGHGVFAGLSTSNTNTTFNFSDPETSLTNYFASRSTTQMRLEAGYQFNSKPIFLKSSSSNQKSSAQKRNGCSSNKVSSSKESSMKKECGSFTRSSSACGKMKSEMAKHRTKKEMIFVRLQPQLGMAYIPSVKNDFAAKVQGVQSSYTYNAGNWNTALISGMGVEFGKGKAKYFQITLQYLKGIGNMDNTILTTQSAGKTVETSYASRASSWNLSFGVPISFAKKPAEKNKVQQRNHHQQRKHHEEMRSKCSGIRRI